MVLAERSGRWVSVFCQMAISFHMAPPCYRHSYLIGTVFGEIDWPTLPIIYHLRGKTAPIRLLFGTARLMVFKPCPKFVHRSMIWHSLPLSRVSGLLVL